MLSRTFDVLAKAGAGSGLVFTYVRQDFLDGTTKYNADALYKRFVVRERLWRFGMRPEQVNDFLAPYGWREVEQVGAEGLAARYVRPTGRAIAMSEIERCVLAEKI